MTRQNAGDHRRIDVEKEHDPEDNHGGSKNDKQKPAPCDEGVRRPANRKGLR